jgi:hypothetical protein
LGQWPRDILVDVSEQRVSGWKRFFMWDFPRGSVAYDIKVGAILAFIFLTPAWVFRDQPTLDKAKDDIVMLPLSGSDERYWLESGLVEAIPSSERIDRLAALISDRTGRTRRVVRLEPLLSDDGKTQGYVATARQ